MNAILMKVNYRLRLANGETLVIRGETGEKAGKKGGSAVYFVPGVSA